MGSIKLKTYKLKKIKNLNWPQAKARFPNLLPSGDADGDGLKNKFDCKPFDKTRKGKGHKINDDNYGFKFVYKKPRSKKEEDAQEVLDSLD